MSLKQDLARKILNFVREKLFDSMTGDADGVVSFALQIEGSRHTTESVTFTLADGVEVEIKVTRSAKDSS